MYLKEKGLDGDVQIWANFDGDYIGINMTVDMSGKWNRTKASFYLNRKWAERLHKELGLAIDELIRNKRHKEEGGKNNA